MTFTCQLHPRERHTHNCVPCTTRALADAYEAEKKRADEAAELLREMEWKGRQEECGRAPVCPHCEGYSIHGHDPECKLAKAIGKAGG